MANDLNEVTIIGRLGADPEVRSFQNGGQIANLRVATSESWKDRQSGEKQERTEWHSVTIRGEGLIKVAQNFLRKGSRVWIRGKLQTRKWQDNQGNDRYSTEIVLAGYEGKLIMLGDKQSSGGGTSGGSGSSYGGGSGGSSGGSWGGGAGSGGADTGAGRRGGFTDDLDDDIPF